MNGFERVLIATVREYRAKAAAANCRSLYISVEAEGRVDGDLKITFSVREMYESSVSGNDLAAVFKEFLRRKGWVEQHAPLCLPNVEESEGEGE